MLGDMVLKTWGHQWDGHQHLLLFWVPSIGPCDRSPQLWVSWPPCCGKLHPYSVSQNKLLLKLFWWIFLHSKKKSQSYYEPWHNGCLGLLLSPGHVFGDPGALWIKLLLTHPNPNPRQLIILMFPKSVSAECGRNSEFSQSENTLPAPIRANPNYWKDNTNKRLCNTDLYKLSVSLLFRFTLTLKITETLLHCSNSKNWI